MMVAMLLAFTGLMILTSLELRRSFLLLQKRTELFLCTKEMKGELNRHLIFMGKMNWALKNLDRLKWVALFIPGLQGASLNAERAKFLIMRWQDIRLALYLKSLGTIKGRGCPLDLRVFKTPFLLGPRGLMRNMNGTTRLRSSSWTYYNINLPYSLALTIKVADLERIKPLLKYQTREIRVKSPLL
jgi:hypothetical protein